MNSLNHYAYGAIGNWMYRQMVGIDTYEDGPGYKHIKIKPQIGEGFTYASASLKTYYGTVSSDWKVEGNNIILDVKIPANTKATVFLPSANASKITESGKPLTALEAPLSNEENYTILQLGSGKYSFRIKK
ncbi:MAG: hypothetical protein BGN92_14510 [Sphingobacteriales bacterium 41-5]|nr:MAG: hypothetical protein BGN92_14510 [Sphingobacteriales bacterium 41-5]